MVIQQVKTVLLSIIKLLRRMMCCFSFGRRRKPSFSEPMEIKIVVDGGKATLPVGAQSPNSTRLSQTQHVERDWNTWDDSPRTVTEHIEQYRQRLAKPPTPPAAEQEPDFFTELTPVIKPQPKYYLGGDNTDKANFSRLEAKTDVPITMNADLEDWVDDSVDGGWDELDTEQTKQLIRENRRQMRQQRQQKNSKTAGIETSQMGRGAQPSRT
nr:receptor-binding cancer antigen expressed on SiSo cells [Bactrocera oleae]